MKPQVEVTILGSGTCVPSIERGSPGLALNVCDDFVLLDGGSGTLRSLLRAGLDYRPLTHVLYTHAHGDHSADLVPLIMAMKYTPGFTRTQDLNIWGPVGFIEFFQKLTGAYPFSLEGETFDIEVREVSNSPHPEQGWRFSATPLRHFIPTVGYRIEVPSSGLTLVYTGDTGMCPELVQLASGADLLIIECSFPGPTTSEGHLTPAEAGQVAEEAGVKRLLLTHLYPACDEEDVIGSCRKYYSGPVEKAEDLMRISLV